MPRAGHQGFAGNRFLEGKNGNAFGAASSRAQNLIAQGQKLPKQVPVSAILFGPPGTSKTEIVEQIASYIGWPAMTVDPSYFVKKGMDAIQAQANRIFRMLSSAEQIVVLFDEFDEMVKNRADAGDVLSRFLTTAMLPKLATINKERKILFIVATNYIDSFDIAISRPGRFDFIFQMMPPKATEKLKHKSWAESLGWLSKQNIPKFRMGLADLTFLETEKLVRQLESLKGATKSLNDLKGSELARAKLEAKNFWNDATKQSILNGENERYTARAKGARKRAKKMT